MEQQTAQVKKVYCSQSLGDQLNEKTGNQKVHHQHTKKNSSSTRCVKDRTCLVLALTLSAMEDEGGRKERKCPHGIQPTSYVT